VGTSLFHIENFSGQNNSLLDHHKILEANLRSAGIRGIPTSTVEVPCTTVDAYLAETGRPTPSFVKIDVEGAEISVLNGMRGTLRRGDVALMVEVTENEEPIYRLLREYGFIMFNDRKVPVEDPLNMAGNIFCVKGSGPRAGLFLRQNGKG